MRSEPDTHDLAVVDQDQKDRLCRDGLAQDPAAFVHGAKNPAARNAGRGEPSIDIDLGPSRHGHGSYAPVLSQQIRNHPAAVTLLNIFGIEPGGLGAAQSATD